MDDRDGREDKELIFELINNEFNLQPTIKQCKRLGKPVADKTQSLLVTLDSVDHVKIILSDAKKLRKSLNNFVQTNVFINADLTKAEASVAYEERCRRRQLRLERPVKKQQQQQQQPKTNNVLPPATTSSGHSGVQNITASSSKVIASTVQLNVKVPVFQPASSSSFKASGHTSSCLPAASAAPDI